MATNRQGPRWLTELRVAGLVADSLHHRDGRVYRLDAFCIMPNHVHLVCTPLETEAGAYHSLTAILHSLKRHTAREANKLLPRQGAFWQPESCDRAVRDESELRRIVDYVLNNQAKAGLVDTWEEWPWSYANT